MASKRRCWKHPSYLTAAKPANSKTDMWLAKAKPKSITDGSIVSKIMHLRSGEKCATTRAGLLAGFVTLGETHAGETVPDRLHPTEEVHARAMCSFRTMLHGKDLVWTSL
ncbi:hypothetical protein HGM15179_014917 [Zosterops borbonicus]|uniref:Uncharacterized protein n=1 Tax=Zosterops borbonicus TaxID=364589 RepID=A0A8K1G640_9PASS|nr:hypothetical protein HGM15179_014917 [Zosterops borbonicus]